MEPIDIRASCCGKAIEAYGDDLPESNLIDLLADAIHFCDVTGLDFQILLLRAGSHYLAELRQPNQERNSQ
jgi:hypothetical protein